MFFFSPAVALPGVEVVLPDPRPPGGEVELLGSAPPSGAVELLGPRPPDEEDELLGPVPPDAESATSTTSEADPPPWDSMKSIARNTSSSSPSPLIVNLEPSKNIIPTKTVSTKSLHYYTSFLSHKQTYLSKALSCSPFVQ